MSARLLRELPVADGPVVVACRVLGISRSRFYEAADRAPSVRPVADQEFTATIASIHTQSRGTCRAPRVHAGVLARAAPSDRGPEQLPMLPPRHRRTPWGAHRRTTRVLRSTMLPRSHSNSSRSRCCDDQLNPPNLRDLAVLGVATHAHTAALHGADLTGPGAPNRQLKPLLDRTRAWQEQHHNLTSLITASSGNAVVRDDLIAITPILQTLAPITTTAPASGRTADLYRPLVGALNAAIATMTQIAGWSSLTLDRLARSGHVHVPGRARTGEQVTDRPDLATARLTGHLTPAPDETRRAVTATYQALRTHPFQPSPPAVAPEAGIDRAADVNVITRAGYGW